jgi:hypothetical protein
MVQTVDTQYLLDDNLRMKAAALVAASAASSDILDLGANSFTTGDVLIDVTALEIASNDEAYTIVVQGSPDAAFGTAGNIHELCALHLGAKETKLTDCDKDDVVGRYVLPMRNKAYDTIFRYVRLYTVVAGTIATGINYSAYLCVDKSSKG